MSDSEMPKDSYELLPRRTKKSTKTWRIQAKERDRWRRMLEDAKVDLGAVVPLMMVVMIVQLQKSHTMHFATGCGTLQCHSTPVKKQWPAD
jgi:hypothetical protein